MKDMITKEVNYSTDSTEKIELSCTATLAEIALNNLCDTFSSSLDKTE